MLILRARVRGRTAIASAKPKWFSSALMSAFLLMPALVLISALMLTSPVAAIAEAQAEAEAKPGSETPTSDSKLVDPTDGWLDVSAFLDTAYGFVPVISPITEPAVGYGAAGALVFIDRNPPPPGGGFVRPNIAAVGGLATENGTNGVFGAHLGTWMDGRLNTIVGLADVDMNLEFFGLGGDRIKQPDGLKYSMAATGGMAGGSYRVSDTHAWLGLRYAYAETNVTAGWSRPQPPIFPDRPVLPTADLSLDLAVITPTFTFDTRDNFFTPTSGWYADLSANFARSALGSDRDFERVDLNVIHYRPVSGQVYLGIRGAVKSSSDGTPFFMRPFVVLRGVEAVRYQGDQAAEIEAETRWQFHPRISLVAFGGAGAARSSERGIDAETNAWGAGVGFRYLAARTYGLHMGVDVATGPDGLIFYVIFGNAWMRP